MAPRLRVLADEGARPGWLEPLFPLINGLQVAFIALWSAVCVTLAFVAGLLTFRREPVAVEGTRQLRRAGACGCARRSSA